MAKKRGREGASAGSRRVTNFFSSFTHCSRCSFLYVNGVLHDMRHGVMLLLALQRLRCQILCLFEFNIFDVVFQRVSLCAFCPKRFLMLFSFKFSYLKNFVVVFYLCFYFYLATGRSARNNIRGL